VRGFQSERSHLTFHWLEHIETKATEAAFGLSVPGRTFNREVRKDISLQLCDI